MRTLIKTTILCSLVLGAAACEPGAHSLSVSLPDQQARDETRRITIWVVEPAAGASCQDLVDLQAHPGDANYAVEQELEFTYPVDGAVDRLRKVGPGTRLFYAEAENASQAVILNGCTTIKAGAKGPGQISIELAWLGCETTNGGVETCDGVDNDCNNAVDDGDPVALCPTRDHAVASSCALATCNYDCQTGWFDADGSAENGCECRPTRNGEEWCDGLDNDCDGTVDGAGCTSCSDDADCSAPADCLGGTCTAGICQVTHFPDTTVCNDGDGCTENETCQGGFCLGTARDCSDALDCTADTCDPLSGDCTNTLLPGNCLIGGDTCVADGQTQVGNSCLSCNAQIATDQWQIRSAGSPCDDGLWCTGTDTCDAGGQCLHADLPCTDMCRGACDEGGQSCGFDDAATPCDDGFNCTENDACDGQGRCVGVPEPGYCSADQECLPECATDALGCVGRPSYVTLTCPTDAPLDEPAVCAVSLANGDGLEGCLHCEVELLPSIVSATSFYEWSSGCGLGDWEQRTDAACQTNNSGSCPYFLGDTPSTCCSSYNCNSNDRTIEFRFPDCNAGGWRLQQTFDFSSFERVRACYGVLQGPEPSGGSLEILTDPGDELDGSVVACDPPGVWAADYPSHPCVALPGSVTDMPQTRLSFWAQVRDDFTTDAMLGLSDIRLSAYPPECNQEVLVVDTDFAACGHDISSFDGWSFYSPANPTNCAEAQDKCGRSGGLLLGTVDGLSSPQVHAEYELDLRPYVSPGRICWNMYRSVGFSGDLSLNLHSIGGGAAWWVPIYELQYQQFVPSDECRELCIDLDTDFTNVIGQNGFGVGLDGTATSGYLLLTDFKLYASEACDASGVLAVSEVQEDGLGGHQVQVTSSQGLPRRARVTCSWGNEGMQRRQEIEFKP